MSKTPRFPPKPHSGAQTIALVLFEDFQLLDAAGPISAFEIASRILEHAGKRAPGAGAPYRLRVASRHGGLVQSSSGIAFAAERLRDVRAGTVDTLMISGGWGTRAAMRDPDIVAAVARLAVGARRVSSVCTGAFVLAAAGLLEGKRATTHWRHAGTLQRLAPDARIEPDPIWIKDANIWTSAGVSAGIDLALAMIAEDHGAEIANAVAREMVLYAQRPGGQTQFSALLDIAPQSDAFAELTHWMRARLKQDLSVETLAARAGMSPRNFARRFRAETGMTPAKAVEKLRIEAARAALERGRSIKAAATESGFADAERMRRAFVRHFGAPPAEIRRTLRRP